MQELRLRFQWWLFSTNWTTQPFLTNTTESVNLNDIPTPGGNKWCSLRTGALASYYIVADYKTSWSNQLGDMVSSFYCAWSVSIFLTASFINIAESWKMTKVWHIFYYGLIFQNNYQEKLLEILTCYQKICKQPSTKIHTLATLQQESPFNYGRLVCISHGNRGINDTLNRNHER